MIDGLRPHGCSFISAISHLCFVLLLHQNCNPNSSCYGYGSHMRPLDACHALQIQMNVMLLEAMASGRMWADAVSACDDAIKSISNRALHRLVTSGH
jgi:hypothetical protein